MRSEGTGGAAVSRVNDPEFVMFATKSGRDIHSDLERAHRPVVSPIKLKPLTAAEEAALYSEHGGNGRRPSAARPTTPRKPAPPARLPAPGPGPSTVEAVGPSAPPPRAQAGRGQTTRKPRSRFDHDQVVDLYVEGYSPNQISRKIGCTRQTVVNILDARGIARRAYTTPKTDTPQPAPAPAAPAAATPLPAPPAGDLAAAGAAIVDHLHDRVSLPTTVRRLIQAGFTTTEVAVYCGVEEPLVVDAMVAIVRQQAAV